MAFIIAFLSFEYFRLKGYIAENEEAISLGKKYKKDRQKEKEGITVANADDISDEKKGMLLNLLPSGSPLKRELIVTSPFGLRVHPISGQVKNHHGIDLKLSVGDDVVSTAPGKVSFSGEMRGYGHVVIIDHLFSIQTLYAHLDSRSVEAGQFVEKGEKIAEGGNSGRSTGPHLHYEIRYNENAVNPQSFIDWDKENFRSLFENEGSVDWNRLIRIITAQ